ncbi:MAG: hypothetical protein ACOYBL_01875 [Lachnospiraceae bacterium]|jgi:hypothetical protein
MRNRTAMRVLAAIMCYMLSAISVYGAENATEGQPEEPSEEETEQPVYDWTLLTGEVLYLPEKGEVLTFDESLFSLQEDGGFAAGASGEGEIIVRYRVQIEEAPNQSEPEMPSGDRIEEPDTDGVYPTDDADHSEKEETEKESKKEQEELPLLPMPEIKAEEEKITLAYDKRYDKETVAKDFEPVILLPQDKQVSVVSCSVNGIEESYRIEDNRLILDNKVLTEGKNRIVVTVRDEQGNLIVMEPWEFMMQAEEKEQKEENRQKTDDGVREQKISLGMSFLLIGTAFVYYEKKRYESKKESRTKSR